ncbi:hypothetical protein [Rhizobium sp. 16-449-1b]|uniref:hypothetical protein n=1 Tax=Rhizobium sp. 16-449-1b TaxID=2819989 RepID=UPI001FFE1311|nr:hypothetical protein [Rhizobium sp. 16-449-1b]
MSRLSQMLTAEVKRRQISEIKIADEFGWAPQTFNTWKHGVVPRQNWFVALSNFLNIPMSDVEMLVEEARTSTGNTKLPKIDPVFGKVSDRKDGKFAFPAEHGQRFPLGRYAIRVDTKVMEPALLVGTKAWLDPSIWPQTGNDVLVHTKSGAAWIGQLAAIENNTAKLHRHAAKEIVVSEIEAIHVIVLSERLPSGA